MKKTSEQYSSMKASIENFLFDVDNSLKTFQKFEMMNNSLNPLQKVIKVIYSRFGFLYKRNQAKRTKTIVFTNRRKNNLTNADLIINLKTKNAYDVKLIELAEAFFTKDNLRFTFDNFNNFSLNDRNVLSLFINQIHPEALTLFPVCRGKGIDVGCGHRKTHPKAIGVDWVKKGEKGTVGNVIGKISSADINTSGDELSMFKTNSLDFVVSRHNLEHYQDPRKTLNEWTRVLKKEGMLGVIVPNYKNPLTYEDTHYYNFSLQKLKTMINKTHKYEIIGVGSAIPDWSFYCIATKTS